MANSRDLDQIAPLVGLHCLLRSICPIIIPCCILVAGYIVFTLAVRVSVRLHFVSIRLQVFINRFHSNFAYAFVLTVSFLGLFLGKF